MSKCAFRYSAIAAILVTALFFPRLVLASLIVEVEPNNTGPTAQDIPNSAFTVDANGNITNSTIFPHVSIDGKGGAGGNAPDFFRFTTAGSTIILDIDDQNLACPVAQCPDVDVKIGIWNSAGVLIAQNDTSPIDPGSDSTRDPFLFLTGLPAGTYTVGVCEGPFFEATDCTFANGFSMTGNFLDSGEGYLLHISVVPEPSILILLGAGFAAMGFRRRSQEN